MKDLKLSKPQGALGPFTFVAGGICGVEQKGGVSIHTHQPVRGLFKTESRGQGLLTRAQARKLHKWLGEVIKEWDAEQ